VLKQSSGIFSNFCAEKPPLLQAANRCATLLKTERYEKKAKNLSEFTE